MKVKVLLWSIFVTLLLLGSCDLENENLPPQDFTIRIEKIDPVTVIVKWEEARDPEGGDVSYSIYLEDALIAAEISRTEQTLENLLVDHSYSGKIIAIDDRGNRNIQSFTFQTDDAPLTISLSKLERTTHWMAEFKNFRAEIKWGLPLQLANTNEITYNLKINNVLVLENTPTNTFWIEDISEGSSFTATVMARFGDNSIESSNSFAIPHIPSQFYVKFNYVGYTAVHFAWDKSSSLNSSVSYDIYLDDNLVKSNLMDTSLVLTNLADGTTHWIKVRAKDIAGQYRDWHTSFSLYKIYKPNEDDLHFFVYNISNDQLNVYANYANASSYAGYFYKIYLDDNFQYQTKCVYSPGSSNAGFQAIKNLTPNSQYKVRVAFDFTPYPLPNTNYENIVFTTSKEVFVKTSANPLSEGFSELSFSEVTGTTALLSWSVKIIGPSCTPGSANESIVIYLNGVRWYTLPVSVTKHALSGLTPNSNYLVKIVYEAKSLYDGSIIAKQEKESYLNTGPN